MNLHGARCCGHNHALTGILTSARASLILLPFRLSRASSRGGRAHNGDNGSSKSENEHSPMLDHEHLLQKVVCSGNCGVTPWPHCPQGGVKASRICRVLHTQEQFVQQGGHFLCTDSAEMPLFERPHHTRPVSSCERDPNFQMGGAGFCLAQYLVSGLFLTKNGEVPGSVKKKLKSHQ